MKAFILTLASCAFWASTTITSQNIEKDLQVSENILSSVIKNSLKESGFYFPSSFEVSGDYSDEFGVIFKVKAKNLLFGTTLSKGGFELSKAYGEIAGRKRNRIEVHEDLDVEGSVVEAATEFLADYGHLIRGLKSDQKVRIDIGPERSNRLEYLIRDEGQSFEEVNPILSTSVTVKKSDIDVHRNGSIDREEFMDRIEIEEIDPEEYKSEDFELMTSIFKRLYEKDLSKTYFLAYSPPLYYEIVADVGVTFYMKVYSSNVTGNNYSIPTRTLKNLTYEERNEKVEEMYPEFLDELKENILEYGRVIKTLETEQMVVFKVDLTECKGCDMPTAVSLSIPFGVIENYGNNKIKLDAAKAKFKQSEK